MSLTWFGSAVSFHKATLAIPLPDPILQFGFTFPNFRPGDVLKRILVGYSMMTEVVLDEINPLPPPTYGIAVWTQIDPTNDADPSSQNTQQALRGDALFRDYIRWHARRWTDGTQHGTFWEADSGEVKSQEGQRTIINVVTFVLNVGFQVPDSDVFQPPVDSPDVPVSGTIHLNYLVDQKNR